MNSKQVLCLLCIGVLTVSVCTGCKKKDKDDDSSSKVTTTTTVKVNLDESEPEENTPVSSYHSNAETIKETLLQSNIDWKVILHEEADEDSEPPVTWQKDIFAEDYIGGEEEFMGDPDFTSDVTYSRCKGAANTISDALEDKDASFVITSIDLTQVDNATGTLTLSVSNGDKAYEIEYYAPKYDVQIK